MWCDRPRATPLQLRVDQPFQRLSLEDLLLERHARDPSGGLVARMQCRRQRSRLLKRRQQLDLHDDLHRSTLSVGLGGRVSTSDCSKLGNER
jgi:hypothetical protein